MALIKFRSNSPVVDPFGSVLEDFFGDDSILRPRTWRAGFQTPAANIRETEKGFHIELAAPGMKKEDFQIEINEDVLTIHSEKEVDSEDKHEDYAVREFNYRSFSRSFRLPQQVDDQNIKATYRDGVLSVDIPKIAETNTTRKIEVN